MAKNYLLKSLLMLSALLIGTAAAYAQKVTVRGVVSDEQGPLIGVSVVVKDPPPRLDCNGHRRLLFDYGTRRGVGIGLFLCRL